MLYRFSHKTHLTNPLHMFQTSVFQIHNSEQSSGPQAMRYVSSGLQAKCPTPYEWPSIVLRCLGSPSCAKQYNKPRHDIGIPKILGSYVSSSAFSFMSLSILFCVSTRFNIFNIFLTLLTMLNDLFKQTR